MRKAEEDDATRCQQAYIKTEQTEDDLRDDAIARNEALKERRGKTGRGGVRHQEVWPKLMESREVHGFG